MWTDNSTSDYFAKMNYTFFTGKMVALNENADTLEFKEWREATIINLDGDIFYRDYKEGYMEMISQGPLEVYLATKTLKDTKGPHRRPVCPKIQRHKGHIGVSFVPSCLCG